MTNKDRYNNSSSMYAAVWIEISFLIIFIALAIYFLWMQSVARDNLTRANRLHHESYLIADRLRHSTDDLTRMVRTYVATGDSRFETYFWKILDIRNGKKPRPRNYERIYWDFMTVVNPQAPFEEDQAVSLETLMKEADFTEDEFQLLEESKRKSDKLVSMEEIAMRAMKGEFKDYLGNYTITDDPDPDMAMGIVFGEAYHQAKKEIMGLINVFYGKIDQRTSRYVEQAVSNVTFWQTSLSVVFCLLILNGGLLLLTVKRHHTLEIAARKRSESRLKEAHKIAQIGNWELDLRTDTLTWSDEIYRIFEVDPLAFKASYAAFIEFIHPEDREMVDRRYQDSLKHRTPYSVEHRLLMKDGRVKYVHEQGKTDYDVQGRAVRSLGIVQDVTAQKLMEAELNATQMHYVSFINASIDMVAYLKAPRELKTDLPPADQVEWLYYSTFVDANKSSWRHFGLENKTKLIGKQLIDMLGEKKLKRAFSDFVANQYQLTNYEIHYTLKNGQAYFGLENWWGFVENGRLTHIWIISKDITGHKNAEKEKVKLERQLRRAQKMEALGTLSGGIAHDFNNILFPIMGNAEMLCEDIPESSPHRELADTIYKGAQRARDLVKQLLTFSRETEQELRPLSVHLVVGEALKLIKSSLPSTIKIVQHLDKQCGLVLADVTQLHQISMNLITNAYHAMEASGGILEINLNEVALHSEDISEPSMAPGRYVCLTVSDTGKGIKPKHIERIFDPYFTTKGEGKGTGLGLSIALGIIKSYRGDIKVYSELNKGTVFKVFLPVIETTSEQTVSLPPFETLKGSENVLIVDDELDILKMEKNMLERLGYHVTVKSSSREAFEIFRSDPEQFDVIISDMTMPEMAGDTLARRLLEVRPDIPIIICSGFNSRMNEEKAKKIGIRGFIMKPVIKREVVQAIREAVDAELV
jgi:PAS domain S-box-containing protein